MKRILSVLLVLSMIMSLTGCFGKKEEVVEQVDTSGYEEAISTLQDEINSMKKEIALYDPKYQTTGSFKNRSIIQGGKTAYQKINDKIVLKGTLIENTGNKSNTATIQLSNGTSITPNKNWNVSISTSETTLSMDKAYGTIKLSTYDNDWNPDGVIYEFIKPYFSNNDLDIQSQRDIFVGDDKVGEEAKARILVYDSTTVGNSYRVTFGDLMDSEQAKNYNAGLDSNVDVVIKAKDKLVDGIYRAGILVTRDGLLEYQFIAESGSADVLVDNLLNTIQINGNSLYLQ